MRVQRWRADTAVVLVCAFALISPRIALADDAAAEARAAYNLGLVAHEAGDEKSAAREFARADALVPSPEALEAATASALRADDAILGMMLVERAHSRVLDAQATETIERARHAFALRVVTIAIDCNGATDCSLAIDGATSIDAHAPALALAGKHTIVVSRDKIGQTVNIASGGGEVISIAAPSAALAPTPVAEEKNDSSIARPVAFGAIGVTLLVGGFAIASGIDAKTKRSDFERGACGTDAAAGTSPSADCGQLADSGRAAQLRTNWLIAGTAVAAAATLAFVIIAKPFGSRSHVALSASASGVQGVLTFAGL
jgi:hypothetical protein